MYCSKKLRQIASSITLCLLLCTLLLTGCGTKDKLTGKWIGYQIPDNPTSPIVRIAIEKDGSTYQLTQTTGTYGAAPSQRKQLNHTEAMDNPWANIGAASKNEKPIYALTYTWKELPATQQKAALKDNKLIIDGMMGTDYYTFDEKTDTLLHGGSNDKSKFKRDTDKEFTSMQAAAEEKLMAEAQRDNPKNQIDFQR